MQKISKLIVAIIILGAVVLAAPFGLGIIAEKEAHKKTKEIQVALEQYPNIEYKLTSYKRGIFKSKAEELIILKNLKFDGKEVGPIELVLSDEIHHGPIIVNKTNKGKFDFWLGRAVIKSKLVKVIGFNVNPLPLDFYVGSLGFSGEIRLAVDMPRFVVDLPSFSVVLENIRNQFEISSDFKKITNQFELKNAVVTDKIKPQKLELKGLDVSTEVSKNEQGLWLGTRRMQVEFAAVGLNGKNYTMKGLYSKVRDIEHDKQLKSEMMLNVRSAGVDEKFYGPHHLTLEVDGIDASLLSRLNTTMMEISHEHLASSNAEEGTSQLPEAAVKHHVIMKKAADLAADLVKKGFIIEIKNLEVSTPWGKLTANSSIKVPDLSKNQGSVSQLSIFSSILNIDAVLHAQLPTQLVKSIVETRYRRMIEDQAATFSGAEKIAQASGQSQYIAELADKHLAKLVADGWFVPKAEMLDISLSFKKGEFLVNNKPLKPQALFPKLASPAPANDALPAQGEEGAEKNQNSEAEHSAVPGSTELQSQQPVNRLGYPENKPAETAVPAASESEPKKEMRADTQASPLVQPASPSPSGVEGADHNQPAGGAPRTVPKMNGVVNPSVKDNISPAEKNIQPASANPSEETGAYR